GFSVLRNMAQYAFSCIEIHGVSRPTVPQLCHGLAGTEPFVRCWLRRGIVGRLLHLGVEVARHPMPTARPFCFTCPMGTGRSSVARVVWLAVAGLVAVAVLFAPVVMGGWSADAPVGGTSACGTFQRSIVGIATSMWLWLALSGVVVF